MVPDNTKEWFTVYATSRGSTRKLLLISALTSTSALIGKTMVKVFGKYEEPANLFMIAVAPSGSGKTPACHLGCTGPIVGHIEPVSGQLAPETIRPGRLAPESTNITMFLLFVFYRGFLRTIQYYMFLLFTSYKLLRCVEIKVFHFEVKAKERLVGSVEMQSEICERRWSMLLEQNNHM